MLRRGVPALLLLLLVAALAGPAGAGAAPRSIGTQVVDVGQAPFVVAVRTPDGACTGSLLDASRVLTAAHCVYAHESPQAYGPGDVTVVAKTSTVPPLPLSPTAESHPVARIDRHPYYVQRPGQISPNDLAVLVLATPVALDANAQPIGVGGGDGPMAAGRAASVYGFGASTPDVVADGRLRVQTTQLAPDDACGNDAPTIVCTLSATSGSCPGDSGGPVVVAPRTLAAVVAGARNAGCAPGNPGTETDLTAGENGAWVAGNATPPRAPRYGSGATYTGFVDAGTTLTCQPGTWTGDGFVFVYTWTDAASGAVVQSGLSPDRHLVDADVGRSLGCTIVAVGPGGSSVLPLPAQRVLARRGGTSGSGTGSGSGSGSTAPGSSTTPATPGAAAPTVRLSVPRTVRHGRRTTVTVRVTAGATAFTGARLCVRMTGRATSRANRRSACRTLNGPAGGGTVTARLRVRPAHRGGVAIRVTARLGSGGTAQGSITRRVR